MPGSPAAKSLARIMQCTVEWEQGSETDATQHSDTPCLLIIHFKQCPPDPPPHPAPVEANYPTRFLKCPQPFPNGDDPKSSPVSTYNSKTKISGMNAGLWVRSRGSSHGLAPWGKNLTISNTSTI